MASTKNLLYAGKVIHMGDETYTVTQADLENPEFAALYAAQYGAFTERLMRQRRPRKSNSTPSIRNVRKDSPASPPPQQVPATPNSNDELKCNEKAIKSALDSLKSLKKDIAAELTTIARWQVYSFVLKS